MLLLRYDVLRYAPHVRNLGEEGRRMGRCTELCTKDATGTCAVCEALAERDRFLRFWRSGQGQGTPCRADADNRARPSLTDKSVLP